MGWDLGLCGELKVISAVCLPAPSPARSARRGDAQRPPACHGSRRHRGWGGEGGARSCSRGVPNHGVPQHWGPAPRGPACCPNPERPGCGSGAVSPPPQSARLRCRLSAFLAPAPGLFSLPVAEFLGRCLESCWHRVVCRELSTAPGTGHGTGHSTGTRNRALSVAQGSAPNMAPCAAWAWQGQRAQHQHQELGMASTPERGSGMGNRHGSRHSTRRGSSIRNSIGHSTNRETAARHRALSVALSTALGMVPALGMAQGTERGTGLGAEHWIWHQHQEWGAAPGTACQHPRPPPWQPPLGLCSASLVGSLAWAPWALPGAGGRSHVSFCLPPFLDMLLLSYFE